MSNVLLFAMSAADDMTQVGMPTGEMGSAHVAPPDSDDAEHITRGAAIVKYLVQHSPEFVELRELRKLGRENPAGDRFFQQQRARATNPNTKTKLYFYKMMKRIGDEMQRTTGALKIKSPGSDFPQILDMGMAPGGFLATAMKLNPGAKAVGFSLPIADGGYQSLVPEREDIDVRYLDVTMLAGDLGFDNIPADHPDAEMFLPRQFEPGRKFDLVICSSSVVHEHKVGDYRKITEPRRLATSQLALGLERLNPGGTMIVLFHNVEAWTTVVQLYRFRKFCKKLFLFKPTKGHEKRSSFYMVATGVQSRNPEAFFAVERWKQIWRAATLDVEGTGAMLQEVDEEEPTPEEVLREFGEDLVRLGKRAWSIQANALRNAPFMTGH
ncbi:hypothetical protein CGCSCA4_v000091 [Colletotrichum siamense]|uniref:Ribosomal RNA methyltransferase FtsJ domain-containing protein n=1 Tax=Colletotrichum siamense TaxID=690259 RepID=A0A9P5EXA5_COLSI|nr:hypothetical protein CGCSCA4_v000091 [Colletotrichum siamense]KAF4862131.1 hypothetical protein CGCSCA2_v003909 [Colletotrichum siamense]